jgi:hypothetical protein
MTTEPILHLSEALLSRAQEKYAEAISAGNHLGMLNQARQLYRLYAASGNDVLSRKWTQEYIRCWLNRGDEPPDGVEPAPLSQTPATLCCG